VARPRDPCTERITLSVPVALKTALEAEAWEVQRSLADYVRGLLERRGKWSRTIGTAGGYDLQAEIPNAKRDST
jgi:hypothetical protein